MEIKVLESNQINETIANEIVALVNKNPKVVLGLATGSSPVGMYKKLIEAYQAKKVSFKDVVTFNLDEYVGLEPTHDQSYHYFMFDNLFNHIDIKKENTHFANDYKDYDGEIAKFGGVELQVLGIGSNGHIAFNEPGTSFDSLTHVVTLTESTIKDNARFFASIDDVPKQAISMGLKSIMNAKRIVLIATGANKAKAIARLAAGEYGEDLPVSILKNHPNCTIYVDKDAYSLVK